MMPRIRSKDLVRLEAVDRDKLALDDIVLAKVKGRYWLHKITAIDGDRIQISNNHGHVNGWTNRTKVYALVTNIEEE